MKITNELLESAFGAAMFCAAVMLLLKLTAALAELVKAVLALKEGMVI